MFGNPLPRVVVILSAIAVLTACILALIVARSRFAALQAARQMRAAFSAEEPLIAQANQHERQRDQSLAKSLRKISQTKRNSNNPEEIVESLPAVFPALPQPLSVTLPPPASEATSDEPTPPAVITVPQVDLAPLFDRLQACRACELQLAVAQQDLEDERAKVSALMIERGAAAKAARGGGFWSRLRTGAKWFAIGGAVGALAASTRR